LSLPSPCGKRAEVELNRIRTVFSADAVTKMMRARYSLAACVCASITRTPVARFWRSS
jgi:hypothetical protein